MASHWVATLLLSVAANVHAATAPVELSSAAGSFAADYNTGDLVSVPLYAASASDTAVFGVELGLTAGSDDFLIRAVTFEPAFSQTVGDVSPAVARAAAADAPAAHAPAANAPPGDAAAAPDALPGRQYRAVRHQAVGTLDCAPASCRESLWDRVCSRSVRVSGLERPTGKSVPQGNGCFATGCNPQTMQFFLPWCLGVSMQRRSSCRCPGPGLPSGVLTFSSRQNRLAALMRTPTGVGGRSEFSAAPRTSGACPCHPGAFPASKDRLENRSHRGMGVLPRMRNEDADSIGKPGSTMGRKASSGVMT